MKSAGENADLNMFVRDLASMRSMRLASISPADRTISSGHSKINVLNTLLSRGQETIVVEDSAHAAEQWDDVTVAVLNVVLDLKLAVPTVLLESHSSCGVHRTRGRCPVAVFLRILYFI